MKISCPVILCKEMKKLTHSFSLNTRVTRINPYVPYIVRCATSFNDSIFAWIVLYLYCYILCLLNLRRVNVESLVSVCHGNNSAY